MANGVMSLPVPRHGIDLLGVARGRRAAQNDNYEDLRRLQEQEKFAFDREQRMADLQERQYGRMAAEFTAPLLMRQQQMADGIDGQPGKNNLEALLTLRGEIMQDPRFLSAPPQVQERVLQQLGASAAAVAQQAITAGDPTAAQRLLTGFGVNYVSPLGQVAQSGNPALIIDTAIASGATIERLPNGDFRETTTGEILPANMGGDLARQLAASPTNLTNAQAVFSAIRDQRAAQALAQEQAAAAEAQQRQVLLLDLYSNGFTPQPDGSWLHADGRQIPSAALGGLIPAAETPPPAGPGGGLRDVRFLLGADTGAAAPVAAPVTPAQQAAAAPVAAPVTPAQQAAAVQQAAAGPGGLARLNNALQVPESAGWVNIAGEPWSGSALNPPLGVLLGTLGATAQDLGRKAISPFVRASDSMDSAIQNAVREQAQAFLSQAASPEAVQRNFGAGWSNRRATAARAFERRLQEIAGQTTQASDAEKAALREEAAALTQALRNVRSVNGN